ncbi:MAG: DUF4912 domain-containing protein [Nitrospirota bacterium]
MKKKITSKKSIKKDAKKKTKATPKPAKKTAVKKKEPIKLTVKKPVIKKEPEKTVEKAAIEKPKATFKKTPPTVEKKPKKVIKKVATKIKEKVKKAVKKLVTKAEKMPIPERIKGAEPQKIAKKPEKKVKSEIKEKLKKVIAEIKETPEKIKAVVKRPEKILPAILEKKYPLVPFETLPEEYSENSIALMTVDPIKLFTFWEVKEDTLTKNAGNLTLRVYDVTGIDFNGLNANSYFDIAVSERIGSYYIDVKPEKEFIVDIGLTYPRGVFVIIARSNKASTPRVTISELPEEQVLPHKLYKTDIRFGY